MELFYGKLKYILLFVTIKVSYSVFCERSRRTFPDLHTRRWFFYFPGDDGKLHLVDAQARDDHVFISETEVGNNSYWLYTRNNPKTAQILVDGDTSSVENSHFDRNKETVFLAHGWLGYAGNDMNKLLTSAFLKDKDVNVIVVDWSQVTSSLYWIAKMYTAAAGRGLGRFVNWLTTMGARYKKIHLVGFSLGAHFVGNAGRVTGSRVARITALDPAGPMWYHDRDRIVATDGKYVEVIHTNAFVAGYAFPCGDADFYPNGGSNQPGCWFKPCSHSRSYELMASSVVNNHLQANTCRSFLEALLNWCSGSLNPMGNSNLRKSRHGTFRVNTNSTYPYLKKNKKIKQ